MQRGNPVVFAMIDQSEGMMKTAIRFSISIVLLLTFLAFDPPRAFACMCAGNQPLFDVLATSAAVFSGKVVRDESAANFQLSNGGYISVQTIEVTKMWKGPSNQLLMVANHQCSYPFQVGQEYLIFAREIEGQLVVDSCNRTQPITTAAADVAILNTFFDPSLAPPVRPETVTVRGYGTMIERANYFWIYFRFAQTQPEVMSDEARQSKLLAALSASEISQEMIDVGPFQDQYGVQFAVRQEQLPSLDLAAFLKRLPAAQEWMSNAAGAPIARVEVMFTIEDCTLLAWAGQRAALTDAQQRATMLAASLGGRIGPMIEVIDMAEPPPLTESAGLRCNSVKVGQWHKLPLQEELEAVWLLRSQASVQVTFALEETVSGVQKPFVRINDSNSDPNATPTPLAISPLPTPTMTATATPANVSVLQTPEPPK